ncbi:tRNA (adenosine(37)-N6)-threonylcarbamoyltransferase complex dimerization subunit type 1 TsaB [Ornithinibacillus gellani]|uniref:tRNA (adenosine(37)-N6)-threonylcarbamoyltransferase complex dimerization subunit type 1 TsaB n=1 Tax=Ornithinibacillus gellani TaxID=2293253 RepID=UPI000F478928|nr:tRNA (adenosine(37)-N6)-threonylcarbamoyltransferase complex dimerization subunit type 1 TsaB [Ornithinibacillus gellani]TQS75222.1 tRNA (adenosine(37)-N6)-threonylcarbamoyltransferase complex dimerization subunit type 1 TsaB [Ornithinibacillus gellani]
MYILAIDTSNQVLGVSILKENEIIGEFITNLPKNHSVRLMPAIERLMKEVNVTPKQLERIVVAKGPGSYTGVRIGLTTAKTLAWTLGIPIVGVSSLQVLAYQGRFFPASICPFFDARRGLVFTGLYQWNGTALELVADEKNLEMEAWLIELAEKKEQVLFLSPDIDIHREQIQKIMGNLAVIPEGPFHYANPSHLALAGSQMDTANVHQLTPNYLRMAEAEANWLKSQKESK